MVLATGAVGSLNAPTTVNEPSNTAWKVNSDPTPACNWLPWAVIVPVKFPFRSVVTSMNGRVLTPMPVLLPGTVPAGGLKLIVGNDCVKAGVVPGGMSNAPEPSLKKKRPNTVLVEIFCTG